MNNQPDPSHWPHGLSPCEPMAAHDGHSAQSFSKAYLMVPLQPGRLQPGSVVLYPGAPQTVQNETGLGLFMGWERICAVHDLVSLYAVNAATDSHISPCNRHQSALSESARVAASIARRKHRAASTLCCSCARWNRSQRSCMEIIDV